MVGCALLALGLYTWKHRDFFLLLTRIDPAVIEPPSVVIAVGSILSILSLAGVIGSLWENVILMRCFSASLILLVLAEMASGYYGFIFKDNARQRFPELMENGIRRYKDDVELQNITDSTQRYLQCCGASGGPSDWENNIYFNCTTKMDWLVESCGVPTSCCKQDNSTHLDSNVGSTCEYGIRSRNASTQEQMIHTKGCTARFEAWITHAVYALAGFCASISALQMILILISNEIIHDKKLARHLARLENEEEPTLKTWDSDIDFSKRSFPGSAIFQSPTTVSTNIGESPMIGDAPSPWTPKPVDVEVRSPISASPNNRTVIKPQFRKTTTGRYDDNGMSRYATSGRPARVENTGPSSFATVFSSKRVKGRAVRPLRRSPHTKGSNAPTTLAFSRSFTNANFSTRDEPDGYQATDV